MAGAILGLVIIYVYQEIKYYQRDCKRKQASLNEQKQYEAYLKREAEFMRTHEEIPLTCGDDEFYLGSRFMMRKKSK